MTHDRSRPPLPPMKLSVRARALLIGLRVFLGLVTVMAVYTFVHGVAG
jgi:hypothetical protein